MIKIGFSYKFIPQEIKKEVTNKISTWWCKISHNYILMKKKIELIFMALLFTLGNYQMK